MGRDHTTASWAAAAGGGVTVTCRGEHHTCERERERERGREGTPCTVAGGSDCLLTREKVWFLSDVFSALRLEICWLASYYVYMRERVPS